MQVQSPFNPLFLERCRKVTEGHIANHGSKWDLEDQINHIHAEVTEFWLAYHGKDIKEGHNKYGQMMEEASDIILATLTALHLLDNGLEPQLADDIEIQKWLLKTLEKIETRVKEKSVKPSLTGVSHE